MAHDTAADAKPRARNWDTKPETELGTERGDGTGGCEHPPGTERGIPGGPSLFNSAKLHAPRDDSENKIGKNDNRAVGRGSVRVVGQAPGFGRRRGFAVEPATPACYDGGMRVIETATSEEVGALLFTPGRPLLIVGTDLGSLSIHDLSADRACVQLDVPRFNGGGRGSLDADDRTVYAATWDGLVGFDSETGELRSAQQLDQSRGRVGGFARAADGSRLVALLTRPGATFVSGWVPGADGWESAWVIDHGPSSHLAIPTTGDRVAHVGCETPGGWDYRLLMRDAATGELVGVGNYPPQDSAVPLFRPDGGQVVAARGMTLLIWDARRLGKPALVRNDSRRHFTAAAYHPSGRYLFTTSTDATVTVWDTDSWARVKRFDWDIGRLRSVAVSPDGLLAAAGSDRGRVVVWDVDL